MLQFIKVSFFSIYDFYTDLLQLLEWVTENNKTFFYPLFKALAKVKTPITFINIISLWDTVKHKTCVFEMAKRKEVLKVPSIMDFTNILQLISVKTYY